MSQHHAKSAPPESQSTAKLIGALLLLAVAGVFVWFMASRGRTKLDTKRFSSLGEFAAEEAVKVIGKSGRVVVVYDTNDPKAGGPDAGKPFADQGSEADAFKKRLAKLGSFTFAPDWKLTRPPMVFKSVWPEANWSKLAGDASAAIVLFASPPAWTKEEQAALSSRTGKLIVVGGTLPEVEWLATGKLASLVIAARFPVPQPPDGKAETPRQTLERIYAVVAAGEVGAR